MALDVLSIPTLEASALEEARASGISRRSWDDFCKIIHKLKSHNESTYAHSLRVGLYSIGLARLENLQDVKLALYGGCGHDVGKCSLPLELFAAHDLTPDDWVKMREHPRRGYEMLRERFWHAAMIAGLHHGLGRMDGGGYGIDLEAELLPGLARHRVNKLTYLTKIVIIADGFDALTTRKDARSVANHVDRGNPAQVQQFMLTHFPGSERRIDWLIDTWAN